MDYLRIGVRYSAEQKITSSPSVGSTRPPIQRVPGVKQPERVADYSSPSSAKDINVWGLTSTRRNSVLGYYFIEIQA
jgi:hypothetical protein